MKNKIRIFTAMAVVLMIFSSCATAEPEITASATPMRGVWVENTLINPFFGIRFDLPGDWWAMTPEGVEEMYLNGGYVLPPIGSEITSELYGLAETLGIVDLAAEHICEIHNVSITTRIMRLADDEADLTAKGFLMNIVTEFEESGIGGANIEMYDGTVRIGLLDWHYADYIVPNMMHQRYFVNIDHGSRFVRGIIITNMFGDEFHDVLDMFRAY
ncbi:MAG: hypothetical protein FWE34_06515 [Defluviitaleaceae bacterium]|nr:hypothetical protein [Defluviitaleaceae bacterium]